MFKNALVSVSDKTGLVEFLQPYIKKGMRVVSTGGTAQHLRDNGVEVVEVATQTGFPECMDGRVRTLHPNIHIPLLARPGHPEDEALLKDKKLAPFDLVVVNLYPFAQAMEKGVRGAELVEYIDIGGPSLLRAAAKNHPRAAVVCDPRDYAWISEKGELSLLDRQRLAARVFSHTAAYDALIAETLWSWQPDDDGHHQMLAGELVQTLRYGENPQQKGFWFRRPSASRGLHQAEILHGKVLSYNNILDVEAACSTLREFAVESAVVAVKHNSPCGVGTGSDMIQASRRALQADPVSVFGGVIACNRTVDLATAEEFAKIFLECVIAPDFSDEALERLRKKKDLRLLRWPDLMQAAVGMEFRSVSGGYLLQNEDRAQENPSTWQFLGERPDAATMADLIFANKVCAHLKSNAIALASGGQTLGMGMGQVNRVDAVEHALGRMKKFHPQHGPAVLASDAFFPFADSIELIAAAGVKWVVQPGGSIRDEEVMARAKDLGVNMVLTGMRHFRH